MAKLSALHALLVLAFVSMCAAKDEKDDSSPQVLMVLTSHSKLGNTDQKTGWYLPEAAHPYFVFKEAGAEITWASPNGGEAPLDASSVKPYVKDDRAMMFMHMRMPHGMKKGDVNVPGETWKNTVALKDVDPADFDAVFVVGGYGVMWDLAKDEDLRRIAAHIYEADGVVSGVCHGPAALIKVKLSDGTPLVKGKEVACFSNAEEDVMKRRKVVPATCQDSLKEAGAKYTKTKPWGDHVATAGRLITGQNPGSAKSTAEAVVKALKNDDDERKYQVVEKMDKIQGKSTVFGVALGAALGAFAVGFALVAFRAINKRRSLATIQNTEELAEEAGAVE